MKPTEELSKEHRAIQLMLRIMESACGRLETEAEVPTTDLRGMIEFLQIFADKCHHGKEEEVLFPALESAGVPRERGPIGVMLSEHVLGRTYIRQMSVSADRLSQGDESARDPFIANARAYINLLTMHIQKEDHVLFPMADATLPDAVQQDLLKSFERIEAEKIGPGKHEELHALLHQWKTKYLGNEM